MNSYTFVVPLYPRSAARLLEIIEAGAPLPDDPPYVTIDIANFRNHLIAHLQRVELGDDGTEEQDEGQSESGDQ